MKRRIFRATLLVAVAVLLLSAVLVSFILYRDYEQKYFAQIRGEAQTISLALDQGAEGQVLLPALQARDAVDLRITWIDGEGRVLYDSSTQAEQMENHLDREEILAALRSGEGQSVRTSSTLSRRTFYYACRLSDGTVLRVSGEQASVWAILLEVLGFLSLAFLVALGMSLFLSYRVAARIVKPLNELDPERPELPRNYSELTPLLQKLSAQNRQIEAQICALRKREEEFSAVTEHMKEGLLIVDPAGRVLLSNPAAEALLHCRGKNLRELDEFELFDNLFLAVKQGSSGQYSLHVDGRSYRILANPAYDGRTLTGAVLVLLDVTEQESRETLRREFTANVSHELRTPLTAISGFAELIAEGVAKEQDVPRFASHIRRESRRLLSLIEDILRLSQLDEGNGGEKLPQRLDLIARSVAQQLSALAEDKGLEFTVETSPAQVQGVAHLLEEIIYNLCDNAMKYNVTGGSVSLFAGTVQGVPTLRVKDSGIGIPAGEQERIFERFYRVDKSHSKAIGGTGLGLSIVKHAVQFHGAKLRLESRVSRGTTVTVSFPNPAN